MSSFTPYEIGQQQQLLETFRRTLAHLLKQQAIHGEAYVPPSIIHGIDDARENIQQIKNFLRLNNISVDDLPGEISISGNTHNITLANAKKVRSLRIIPGHSGMNMQFTSDGLISGTTGNVNTSEEGVVKIWKIDNGAILYTLKNHKDVISDLAFSSDGKLFATASWDSNVMIWRMSDGSLLQTIKHESAVISIAFSPNGQLLASGMNDYVDVWRIADGARIYRFADHNAAVQSVAFTQNGLNLASGSRDCTVNIRSIINGELIRRIETEHKIVEKVLFSLDGNFLVVGLINGLIYVFNTSIGNLIYNLGNEDMFRVTNILCSKDNQLIISSHVDGVIRIWKLSTGELIHHLDGHQGRVESLILSSNGQLLASSSVDYTIRLWGVDEAVLGL